MSVLLVKKMEICGSENIVNEENEVNNEEIFINFDIDESVSDEIDNTTQTQVEINFEDDDINHMLKQIRKILKLFRKSTVRNDILQNYVKMEHKK